MEQRLLPPCWFINTLAPQEYKPHRIIPLTHVIDSLEIDPISKNKRYCFKIVIPKRSYVLCASSEMEMESWLNALSVGVRRAKKTSSISAATSPTAQSNHLHKLATGSSYESFENTSHISGVSGAGAIGGAGGALPGRAHTHTHKLGRAK